jgi:hypothetical protein
LSATSFFVFETRGITMRTSTARRSLLKKTLTGLGCAAALLLSPLSLQIAQAADPEKDELKLGFIKLTDMAPLAIAYEKGYFEDEGLYVTLEAQANWKVLLDRVITGELDGAHMLAGQPLGATIGFGTKAEVVTAFSMDLNGNGITVSNAVWKEMKKHVPMVNGKPLHPIKADALKPVIEQYKAQGTTTSCATGWRPAASILATTRRPRATSPAPSAPTPCSRSPRRRRCPRPWRPAPSTATAWVSRGTSRPCSRASACR